MDERDRRNARSGWDDRDERNPRRESERQHQQWHDENYRGAGMISSSSDDDEDDYTRERGLGRQMGGSQGSYSGDRPLGGQSDEDRARAWNQGGGDRPSSDFGAQRQSYGRYSADRYSGGDRYSG